MRGFPNLLRFWGQVELVVDDSSFLPESRVHRSRTRPSRARWTAGSSVKEAVSGFGPGHGPEKQLKINQVVAEVAQERAEFGLNLQNRFIGRLCLHYSTLWGLKIVVKTCAHCNTAGRRPGYCFLALRWFAKNWAPAANTSALSSYRIHSHKWIKLKLKYLKTNISIWNLHRFIFSYFPLENIVHQHLANIIEWVS